jgi:hypothetical protein
MSRQRLLTRIATNWSRSGRHSKICSTSSGVANTVEALPCACVSIDKSLEWLRRRVSESSCIMPREREPNAPGLNSTQEALYCLTQPYGKRQVYFCCRQRVGGMRSAHGSTETAVWNVLAMIQYRAPVHKSSRAQPCGTLSAIADKCEAGLCLPLRITVDR